jgi:hypothetical protein
VQTGGSARHPTPRTAVAARSSREPGRAEPASRTCRIGRERRRRPRQGSQFRAVGDAESIAGTVKMVLDRADGHDQSLCDVAVGQAAGGKGEDLSLPAGDLRRRGERGRRGSPCAFAGLREPLPSGLSHGGCGVHERPPLGLRCPRPGAGRPSARVAPRRSEVWSSPTSSCSAAALPEAGDVPVGPAAATRPRYRCIDVARSIPLRLVSTVMRSGNAHKADLRHLDRPRMQSARSDCSVPGSMSAHWRDPTFCSSRRLHAPTAEAQRACRAAWTPRPPGSGRRPGRGRRRQNDRPGG